LPLARIKKVMKSDEAVKMISTEAPMLLARACEIFIADLTSRAYTVAEESRRKMITKQDVMAATTQTDMFDFLLDI
ncbi:transcription factor Hap5a-like protein, partial [Tilletiaria anomala UBC 951]